MLETEAVDRSRALLDCIDDFVNTGDQDRAICQLLKSSVAILKGQAVEIESSLIELCLEESGPDYIKQMILISRIFGNVVLPQPIVEVNYLWLRNYWHSVKSDSGIF